MDEDKVVKFLQDIGLNKQVSDEDYESFQDYFAERTVTSDESSDEGESTIQPATSQDDSLNLADISLLQNLPRLDDVRDLNIDIVNDVVVEIEQNDNNAEVIDNNDEGDLVVVIEEDNDIGGTFNSESDRNMVVDFLNKGCGCKENCFNKFSIDEYIIMRLESAEIDHYHNNVNTLDQVILGILHSLTRDSSMTTSTRQIKVQRKQSKTFYQIKGQPVCRDTFMFCHQIKVKRLKRLKKMYNDNGLVAKVHGNTMKKAHNVTTFMDTQFVLKFLQNYAEQHAIYLPGRSSTVYNTSLKLLPSSDSKVKIYNVYKESFIAEMPEKPVSLRTFTNIWRQTCPNIVVMKPRSDLCSFCQKHYTSGAFMALANEEEKMLSIEKMRAHLDLVQKERAFYKSTIAETKETILDPEVNNRSAHYSFDMAQQVHIPSNPLQPGPIYFLVPFKVGIFGVMCESLNKQVNYLIPESVSTTKGSNLIVSLFHHYLDKNNNGEQTMFIHADNCVGQNKNNILLSYLAWRISNGKNKKIVLSFMPVGHTKFSCDWAFGLFKRKFRSMYVSSLTELVNCVEQSTPVSRVNSAVAVGDEKGEVAVHVYDWLKFFKDNNCKKVPHITKYNHFIFQEDFKGKVHCKSEVDGNHFVHGIFPDVEGPPGFPHVITPTGQ